MSRAAPRFQLPETRERSGLGTLVAAVVHLVVVGLLLLPATLNEDDYLRGIGSPALATGGGGGGRAGARVVRYVDLTAPTPARPRVEAEHPPLPTPRVVPASVPPREERPLPEVAVALPAVEMPEALPGRESGEGAGGAGPGSGGGVGSGQGVGVGADSGLGTGGDGGHVLAPRPRASPFPFDHAPDELQGVEFTIRFFVDERGRVRRVAIEPEIGDRGYRGKVVRVFESWTFYAARTLDGRAVPGQFVIQFMP